jgi:hypothetical protein
VVGSEEGEVVELEESSLSMVLGHQDINHQSNETLTQIPVNNSYMDMNYDSE